MRSGQGWEEASGDTEEGHRGEQGTPGGSQASGDGGDKRWPLCTMGVSSVCVGGDHVCDCEGDCSVSLCEPREGPLFLPSHCTLVLRTGKRGGAEREALESNLRQLSWPEGAQGQKVCLMRQL